MRQLMPNDQLTALLAEAGWSRKAFARAVREAAAARGTALACDHTAVKRWLDGMAPRAGTAQLMALVLGGRLHRPLTLVELGIRTTSTVDPMVGSTYPGTVEDAAETIALLWQADIDGNTGVVTSPIVNSLWSEAPLSWLTRPGQDPFRVRAEGAAVGLADIQGVEAMTAMFGQLDDQYGGEHARPVLIRYLATDVGPLLRGRYTGDAGFRLYSAVAQACLLVAWMSYDSGAHGLAQRYFTQALRLAAAADNTLLAASIVDAMSHQATFLGQFRQASNLARAARSGIAGSRTNRLRAHFFAMEARALAGTGDRVSVERLLVQASELHSRGRSDDDPQWISYFDEAELAAEHAHCYRDLGFAQRSCDQAALALSSAGQSPRSDYFVLMVLGQGQLDMGDVELGCATVRRADGLHRRLTSRRCDDYQRRVTQSLSNHGNHDSVRQLIEEINWLRPST